MQEKGILDAGCSILDARRSRKSRGENQESRIEDVPFGSNGIRLSGWEWIVVAIICLATFHFGPSLWGQLGELKSGPDYRLPYKLSGDYWLYNRLCRQVCSRYDTVVIGDSVVWGHYVPTDDTLSHYLNQNAGRDRFANLGVDGFHPAALGGLIRYYGRDISNKNVILHLNPLWMSDKKQDLQTEKEYRFHHPKLVPQFSPKIPCYKDSWSKRISVAIERHVDSLGWTSHLRAAYFLMRIRCALSLSNSPSPKRIIPATMHPGLEGECRNEISNGSNSRHRCNGTSFGRPLNC